MKVRIQQLDVPNGNTRVYSTNEMEKAIAGVEMLFGEMDPEPGMTVVLSNVSHSIRNLAIEDGYLVGEMTVLNTPAGNQLSSVMEKSDVQFRMSGTGIVTTDAHGIQHVTDYRLISVFATNKGA